MKRRVLLILLAFVLIFTVACGSGSQQTGDSGASGGTGTAGSGSAGTGGSAAVAPTAENGPLTKYDPPIEMRIVFGTSPVQFFPDGDTYEYNVWSRYMEETAGIIFKVLWTADSASTDAYQNKMSVSLASGDLPDVYTAPNYQFFKTAVDAGYAADLTDVWANFRSDRIIAQTQDFELLLTGSTIDGRLMAIPRFQYFEQRAPFLWIREDWMDAVGKGPPKTMDELVELARAFANEDPDGNGRKDTFGLLLQRDLFAFNFGNVNGIMSGFGVPTREADQFFRDTDGVIKYAGILPDAKQALQLLQDMYKEGLIDPEFGVKDAAKLEEDINTHKVGMGFGAEWNSWYPYATVYTADGVQYRPYGIPAADGYSRRIGTNFPVGEFTMVNSAYAHPEAMMKVRNFYQEHLNEDSTQELREIYSDKEQWRFVPFQFGAPSEMLSYPLVKAAIDAGNNRDMVPNGYVGYYDEIISYMEGSPDGNGRRWQLGPNGSVSVIFDDYRPNDVYTVSPISGERPDSFINLMSSLDTIILQAYTEIIMGADISNFDVFVTNWLSAGGQQVLDDLNAMYPA